MKGAALDPRTKMLPGFSRNDREKVWNLVAEDAFKVAKREVVAAADPVNPELHDEDVILAEVDNIRRANPLFDLADLLSEDENDDGDNDGADNNIMHNNADLVLKNEINVELLSYRQAVALEFLKADGSWNNPLEWWKERAQLYPNLARLARRVLCIPATSAPSERLFSHAGLTIAKNRARLNPDFAEDLILLHDVWPFVEGLAAEQHNDP